MGDMEGKRPGISEGVGYRLRPVRLDDVTALYVRCFPDESWEWVAALVRQAHKVAVDGRGLGIVAESGAGEPIGFGQLTLWPRSAEISNVVVAPEWRGRGIGSAIVRYLIDAAREMSADKVEIGAAKRNEKALALYRSLGFSDDRVLLLDLGDGPEPVIFLVLELS